MMKERFERMTLDQLYAVRETLCYLSPPMENHGSSIAQLFADLDDVMCRKSAEWHRSDEYKAKCEQNQKNLAELLGL